MKNAILGAGLAILLSILPYRIMALSAEMFVVFPGATRVVTTNDHYWDVGDLGVRLNRLGFTVVYGTPLYLDGQRVYGVTSFEEHAIAIDSSLSWDARYDVLTHEAGHTHQPFWVNAEEGDCYAEGVAAVLTGTLREHARYLHGTKWTCLGVFLAEWPSIYATAATMHN